MLVVVLFFAALLGIFAAVAGTFMSSAADASRAFGDGLRADEAMRSAIEYIVGQTGQTIQQARGTANVQIKGAKIQITVRDEAARIDINRAPPELLAGIFRQVGVPADTAGMFAARIVDWRDADDKISPNGGAERAAYRAAGRTDGPRNGPFLSVAELALVLGVPARAAAAVAPYVTVASGRDKINPMFADPAVLMAIPGVTEERVRDFIGERNKPNVEFANLITRLGPVENFVTEENGQAVRFDARIQVAPNDVRRYEAVVTVIDGDTEPYRIISWDANPPAQKQALP